MTQDRRPGFISQYVQKPMLPLDLRPSGNPPRPDRHIPLRVGDIVRLLARQPGLGEQEREEWVRLARLLGAVIHHEFLKDLNELKDLYAPLNPDSDCVNLNLDGSTCNDKADERFLSRFAAMLDRANYRLLEAEHLREAIAAPNELGLNYIPNLDLFEHLKVWVRGETQVARIVRGIQTRLRRRMVIHNGFKRMVLALKFRPGYERILGDTVRADVIYLRMFKDVPHVDMEMHLPEQGTKVQMRMIDKASIASPVALGIPTIAIKLLGAASLFSPTLIGAVLAAPISAGLKSFLGFRNAKQKHLHLMIRHLYYMTLANNEGVMSRLVDSAEEEELKEALLVYFVLWRSSTPESPWSIKQVHETVEHLLLTHTELQVDFEVHDGLDKLRRLGLLATDSDGRVHVVDSEHALAILDRRWDDYYPYSQER